MKIKDFCCLLLVCLFLAACSKNVSNTTAYSVAGTVTGAATGALVGSIISNGDVPMSALFGSGIGLAGGMLIGYWLDYQEEARERAVDAELAKNEALIRKRQQEIEALYRRITTDSQREELDPDSFDTRVYHGPTIGVYNR